MSASLDHTGRRLSIRPQAATTCVCWIPFWIVERTSKPAEPSLAVKLPLPVQQRLANGMPPGDWSSAAQRHRFGKPPRLD